MKKFVVIIISSLICGCLGMPDSVVPVKQFEVDRYLGKWYEIARLDHSFERDLTNVTAEYRLRSDGGISVLNRGFSEKKGEWQEAKGKAYFVNNPDDGYLKVSFFGPFYGSYVIFYLDKENYQYAFVSGPDHSYLWLLSRKPKVEPSVSKAFKTLSAKLGFNTKNIIWVDQKGPWE